jgi:hypothetical protein
LLGLLACTRVAFILLFNHGTSFAAAIIDILLFLSFQIPVVGTSCEKQMAWGKVQRVKRWDAFQRWVRNENSEGACNPHIDDIATLRVYYQNTPEFQDSKAKNPINNFHRAYQHLARWFQTELEKLGSSCRSESKFSSVNRFQHFFFRL